MYYNRVFRPCQDLFASAGVVFKQHAAEEVHTPGLEQGDLFEAEQFGHQPIPQQHSGHRKQQSETNQKGDAPEDGSECVHE